MYRLSKEEYSNLLQNAITSKYKKTDKRTATNVNKEVIKHAENQTSSTESKLTAQVTLSAH